MIDKTLLYFVLALATNELIHNIAEITGMRHKLNRLQAYIGGKPYTEMKLRIDTRLKAYALSTGIFIVAVSVLVIFYTLIDLSVANSLYLLIFLLIASFAVTMALVDKFHVDMERVTRPFMKKTKK